MPIGDAIRFIKDIRVNESLRCGSYCTDNADSFRKYIEENGYSFSDAEFEDALRNLKVNAASQNSADELVEIEQWYMLMHC